MKSCIECTNEVCYKLQQDIITTKECNNMRRVYIEFIRNFIEEVNPNWTDDEAFAGENYFSLIQKKSNATTGKKSTSTSDATDDTNQIVQGGEKMDDSTLSKDVSNITKGARLSYNWTEVELEEGKEASATEENTVDNDHERENSTEIGEMMANNGIMISHTSYDDPLEIRNNKSDDVTENEWSETESEVVGKENDFNSEIMDDSCTNDDDNNIPSILDDSVTSMIGSVSNNTGKSNSTLSQLLMLFSYSYILLIIEKSQN